MKLVQEIKKNEILVSDWGVYELNRQERERHHANYIVSQGIFSDYALSEFGVDQLISKLDSYRYEGRFETIKEALLHIKCVEMQCLIKKYQAEMGNLAKLKCPEWDF